MHSRNAVEPTKLTGSARGRKGITVRLSRENWVEMATPAFEAENHTKGMERWRRKARQDNPGLDNEQVERLAGMLRTEFYADLGRRSGASKRAARSAGRKIAAAAQAVAAEQAA
jgi:hypothetical protein